MLQWKATHPGGQQQHNLHLVGGKEDRKLSEEGKGSWEGLGEGVNMINMYCMKFLKNELN